MAKVSIIVPIYNVEMYLEECLESIQRQTLQDLEIICVNDGSKDGSLEIMQRYAKEDSRFIIIDKENGGYGKAMNVGLDRATGEYIGIVEPDDYVPLYMYEDLYGVAAANELDFVKADFYRFTTDPVTEDMNLVYNHLDNTHTYYNQVLDPSHTPELIRFIMNTWSGIYRRDFLEEHHIRHNETPGASFQDNGFFWQTFIYAKRAMFIDKPYYMNRRDNPNSSVNSKAKVYCMNVEYDHIREILMAPGNEEIWQRFKYYYTFKKYGNYMFTLGRIGEGFQREYVERFGKEMKRAREMGELSMEVFTPLEQERIELLIKSPADYYNRHVLYEGVDARYVMESTTFKVGKIVMFIPIKIKDGLKKLMGRG